MCLQSAVYKYTYKSKSTKIRWEMYHLVFTKSSFKIFHVKAVPKFVSSYILGTWRSIQPPPQPSSSPHPSSKHSSNSNLFKVSYSLEKCRKVAARLILSSAVYYCMRCTVLSNPPRSFTSWVNSYIPRVIYRQVLGADNLCTHNYT